MIVRPREGVNIGYVVFALLDYHIVGGLLNLEEESIIYLSRIPLQCVRTIAPKRGWGGHFYTFAVFCPP